MNVEQFQEGLCVECVDDSAFVSPEAVGLVLSLLVRWAMRASEQPGRPREVREAGK